MTPTQQKADLRTYRDCAIETLEDVIETLTATLDERPEAFEVFERKQIKQVVEAARAALAELYD